MNQYVNTIATIVHNKYKQDIFMNMLFVFMNNLLFDTKPLRIMLLFGMSSAYVQALAKIAGTWNIICIILLDINIFNLELDIYDYMIINIIYILSCIESTIWCILLNDTPTKSHDELIDIQSQRTNTRNELAKLNEVILIELLGYKRTNEIITIRDIAAKEIVSNINTTLRTSTSFNIEAIKSK